MAFRLFIARGNSVGQQFIAVQPMVFIGRDPGCDVVLSDTGVSGRHVRITERDGHYFATDLETANGTLLNGALLKAEREISSGDSLGVGTAVVTLTVLEVPDVTDPSAVRKRLTPSGVPSSPKTQTGDRHPRPSDDEEATLPVGRPLPRDELPGPDPRAKYEADTDKTSPLSPALAERKPTERVGALFPNAMAKLELPPPPVPSPPRRLSDGHPRELPTQQVASPNAPGVAAVRVPDAATGTAATVRALEAVPELPPPERERETGKVNPEGLRQTVGEVRVIGAPGAFDEPHDKQTAMVPPLPMAAEPLTELGTPVAPDPQLPTRSERANPPAGPLDAPATASVLVPASELLRRKPDAADIKTNVREPLEAVIEPTKVRVPTVDDPTDPSGVARPDLGPAPESAADRMRRRREAFATLGGQLGWYWKELGFQARLVIGGVLGVVLAVVAIGLWQVFRPEPGPTLPSEPEVLSSHAIDYSFGLGDGVDYEHADFKELRFEVKAPTAAAVMVHYHALDIGTDEVSISANGTEVGFMPADMGTDREIETLLSQFHLKRNENNVVLFDNVKNPPGKERWRIWGLWMELIPVPEITPEQALGQARDAAQRADLLEKQRAAGDDTLFRLWRTYRAGWIALLSLRDDKRTWLFNDLKRKCDATRVELDVQCGTIMLDAKKQMELKNPEGAREILEGVSRFFPTRDHPCPLVAEEKLREYDL